MHARAIKRHAWGVGWGDKHDQFVESAFKYMSYAYA